MLYFSEYFNARVRQFASNNTLPPIQSTATAVIIPECGSDDVTVGIGQLQSWLSRNVYMCVCAGSISVIVVPIICLKHDIANSPCKAELLEYEL